MFQRIFGGKRAPKRPAEESLEESVEQPSPASKKARVEEDPDDTGVASTNGALPTDEAPARNDITEAAKEQEAELEETQEDPHADEDDTLPTTAAASRQQAPTEGYSDLYLDTIDRSLLDFDFEKLCSVTLSNINVYACLVCGKYFQGRGPKSQAYFHALEDSHHVYINMETKRVYVLPEGYEVTSRSLDDIRFQVDPWLPRAAVLRLDRDPQTSWDLANRQYTPGFLGMNNIKANDYFNVVCHALAHVPPLRNYLMLEDLSARPQLAQRFGTLTRKLWNPRAFKAHVSPHELLQEIAQRSGKRFTLTEQADPVDFLAWFLNNLHLALGGSPTKPGSSVVQRVFQGTLTVESQAITARADAADRLKFEESGSTQTSTQRFTVLTLDLPAAPLFADAAIPQVPLASLLAKYDGRTTQERLNTRLRYRLRHPLPPCLALHVKRFSRNKFVAERNPTIVTFAPRSLDMAPYCAPDPALHPPGEPVWYDLVANVTHEAVRVRDDSVEADATRRVWRVQLRDKAAGEWFEMQDLFVERANADTLFTKESYLQIWERRRMDTKPKDKAKTKAKAK